MEKKLKPQILPQKISYTASLVYLTILTLMILTARISLGADVIFFVFLLISTLVLGRTKEFLKDWLPFILMFFAYETMRGMIVNIISQIHVLEPIKIDTFLFGQLPTVFLQKNFWVKGNLHWYDYLTFYVYISHFWAIFVLAFFIWLKRKEKFQLFSWSFLLLCMMGFITYLLFPQMPPWLASEKGYIEKIDKLVNEIAEKIGVGEFFTFAYYLINPNPVAAMPSLHAAWALYVSLFIFYLFGGLKTIPIFLYPLSLSFALIYSGEHYFIDIVMGFLYAFFVFLLVLYLEKRRKKSKLNLEGCPESGKGVAC